jgi:hypothetical protein
MSMRESRIRIAVLVLLGLAGCGEQSFRVNYAPSFSRSARHISVFGVKRDGLLSQDGWAALGPEQAAPFDGKSCALAYAEGSFSERPDLEDDLGEYVRTNGVTDELLALIAPAAKGDTIMLVTIAGRVQQPEDTKDRNSSAQASAPFSGGGRGGRRHGRGGTASSSSSNSNSSAADPFTVSATFYSVAEHRSVGFVELTYSGKHMDEALDEFRTKLEAEFPGSSCSGWDWSAKIDQAGIHSLEEQ